MKRNIEMFSTMDAPRLCAQGRPVVLIQGIVEVQYHRFLKAVTYNLLYFTIIRPYLQVSILSFKVMAAQTKERSKELRLGKLS